MGEAAKIALSAIGMQDTHLLSDNPEKSLFNPSYQQHSQFRKYHNVHSVIENGNKPTWPFGETVKVTMNPQSMGDLLTNLWIHVELPRWGTTESFKPGIGKQAELYIFGMTIEESGSASYNSSGVPYASHSVFWQAMIAAGDPGPGAPNAQMWTYIVNSYDYQYNRQYFTWRDFRWDSFGIPGMDEATLTNLYGEPYYFGYGAPPHLVAPAESIDWTWDYQLLGRKIIKSIKFLVDGELLEEITADWCIIYDNMYQTESQKVSANAAYNRYQSGAVPSWQTPLPGHNSENHDGFFIHIPFFFSQNYGGDVYSNNKQNKTPFPLCAIYKQKITLEIDFFKQSFFTLKSSGYSSNGDIGRGAPPPPPAKKLKEFKIITEEITLSNEESLFFKNNNREIICDFVNKHSSMSLETNQNKRLFEVQLEPSIPVKCFHWFFRYSGYEDEDEYRHIESTSGSNDRFQNTTNRFNFSKTQYGIGYQFNVAPDVLKRAYFSLNGERFPNISNIDYEYFSFYVPKQSQLSISSSTGNYQFNIIYSYNFAMFPKSTMPSGFLDFSGLNSEKTKLHFELQEDLAIGHGGNGSSIPPSRLENPVYNFHMYYTGFKVLRFNNGFVTIA